MHGLRDEFENVMGFVAYNAADDSLGESNFKALALKGHPATLLFNAEGVEVLRVVSIPDEDALRDRIQALLNGP